VREVLRRREARIWVLVLGAILAFQAWGFHGLRHDDAFITYRYAQNLATGNGLVFNPGEKIMGSTSPLHVLLSALVYAIVGRDPLPTVMAVLGCVSWTAQCAALFAILRRGFGAAGSALVALSVALGAGGAPYYVALETNIVAALGSWAIYCALRRRWLLTAALASAAVLTRPDYMLLAVLLFIPCVIELRWRAWRPALVFLGGIVPWVVFAWVYFGSPMPQSAITKFHYSNLPDYATHTFKLAATTLVPKATSQGAFLAIWLLAGLGAILTVRRDRRLWILPAWAALHFGAYLYIRPFPGFTWHLYPALTLFVVLGLVPFAWLFKAGSRRAWLGGLGTASLGVFAWVHGAAMVELARAHPTMHWFGLRDAAYRDVAAYIAPLAAPDDKVACWEVGTIAYYSGLRMFDLGGLITPWRTPRPPNLRWFVFDKLYWNRVKKGRVPVKQLSRGSFVVNIYRAPDGTKF
jgi:hypothetical protein